MHGFCLLTSVLVLTRWDSRHTPTTEHRGPWFDCGGARFHDALVDLALTVECSCARTRRWRGTVECRLHKRTNALPLPSYQTPGSRMRRPTCFPGLAPHSSTVYANSPQRRRGTRHRMLVDASSVAIDHVSSLDTDAGAGHRLVELSPHRRRRLHRQVARRADVCRDGGRALFTLPVSRVDAAQDARHLVT